MIFSVLVLVLTTRLDRRICSFAAALPVAEIYSQNVVNALLLAGLETKTGDAE